MFTHPLDQQEYERSALARRYPEAYNALVEQEEEHRRNVVQNPDVLDRLIGRIKNLLSIFGSKTPAFRRSFKDVTLG